MQPGLLKSSPYVRTPIACSFSFWRFCALESVLEIEGRGTHTAVLTFVSMGKYFIRKSIASRLTLYALAAITDC